MDTNLITKPTLLLNAHTARANIKMMAEKGRRSGVLFRPHFKTHQSVQIGEWFRAEGVKSITVSSVDMAVYFAAAGWEDILIAFTANRREIMTINRLAKQVRLGLLFEEADTLNFFMQHLEAPVDVWLEADNGSTRTGIPAGQVDTFLQLARVVHSPHRLRGVLTHAGNTYRAQGRDEIIRIYQQALADLQAIKQTLLQAGYPEVHISYGDTPAMTLVDHFEGWDEIRPGNFIFYDCFQLNLGVCRPEDIAVGVACPVIAVYPQRGQLALFGGAVHLSKDRFEVNGVTSFGYVCLPNASGWGAPLPDALVSGLWQEHALVNLERTQLEAIHPGDLLVVLPAHSCLTVDLYDAYLTTAGDWIPIKK